MPPAPGQEEPLKRITKIVNSLLANEDCAPFREPVDWRGLELFDYPQIITNMMDLGTIKRRLERGNYSTAHQVAEDIRLVWRNCMTYNADGSDFWLLAKSYARRFEDRYRKIRQEYDVGEGIGEKSKDGGSSGGTTGKGGGGSSSGGGGSKSRSSRSPSSNNNNNNNSSSNNNSNNGSSSNSNNHNNNNASSSASKMGGGRVPTAPPTLDARARFGSNLFLLSGVELGHVLTTCELECPESLEHRSSACSFATSSTSTTSTSSSKSSSTLSRYHIEINVDAIPTDIFATLNTYVTQKVGTNGAGGSGSGHHQSGSAMSPASDAGGGRNRKRQRK